MGSCRAPGSPRTPPTARRPGAPRGLHLIIIIISSSGSSNIIMIITIGSSSSSSSSSSIVYIFHHSRYRSPRPCPQSCPRCLPRKQAWSLPSWQTAPWVPPEAWNPTRLPHLLLWSWWTPPQAPKILLLSKYIRISNTDKCINIYNIAIHNTPTIPECIMSFWSILGKPRGLRRPRARSGWRRGAGPGRPGSRWVLLHLF